MKAAPAANSIFHLQDECEFNLSLTQVEFASTLALKQLIFLRLR
jgi:hypothetical protein